MNMICEFFQLLFMIVVFDLRDKELKYAKELLLIHHKISEQNSARLQDMRV